jgi:ammonia channel protein AmtB
MPSLQRIRFRAYMMICVIVSVFVYPLVVHWCWHEDGWLFKMGFVDLAGDAAVHMVGGFAGLAAAMILGPRQGRFPPRHGKRPKRSDEVESLYSARATSAGREEARLASRAALDAANQRHHSSDDPPVGDGSASPGTAGTVTAPLGLGATHPSAARLPAGDDEDDEEPWRDPAPAPHGGSAASPGTQLAPMSSPSYAILGLFLLLVGWLSFNSSSVGSVAGANAFLSAKVALTTTFAAAAGTATGLAISLIVDRQFIDVRRCINCTLAALVAITGPCHVVSFWASMVIGVIASLVVSGAEVMMDKVRIDDPLSAFAVHGIGGVTGLIVTGLFHETDGLLFGGGFHLLGVQTAGTAAVAAFVFLVSGALFLIVDKVYGLRVSAREELLGADSTEHNIVRYIDASPLMGKGIRSLLAHDPELRDVRHRFMRRSRSFVVLPRTAERASTSDRPVKFKPRKMSVATAGTLPGSVIEAPVAAAKTSRPTSSSSSGVRPDRTPVERAESARRAPSSITDQVDAFILEASD